MKIIYYYQTLIGLDSILDEQIITCSHIILSAFHFGINLDGTPYIHLNDHIPTDPLFQKCWDDLKILSNRGVTVMIMLGGAGGAYETLFSNYTVYYNLLKDIIQKYDFIKGIATLNFIEKLISIAEACRNRPCCCGECRSRGGIIHG